MNKVIQNSYSPIMATDLKGNIYIWNRAAEETLGYPASETTGKMHINKFCPEGLAHRIMKMIRSPEYGDDIKVKNRAGEGTTFTVSLPVYSPEQKTEENKRRKKLDKSEATL